MAGTFTVRDVVPMVFPSEMSQSATLGSLEKLFFRSASTATNARPEEGTFTDTDATVVAPLLMMVAGALTTSMILAL